MRDDVPAPLADLVRRLLAKDPAARPASAEDVLAALDRLAEVALPLQGLPVETFEPGEVILATGVTTNRIMILKEGAVEVVADGVRLAVAEEPGTIFGELSVLLRRPHTVDVRALRRSTLHVADATTFFRDNPGVTLHVATGLARRLAAANDRMLEVRGKLGPRSSGSVMRVTEFLRGALFNTQR